MSGFSNQFFVKLFFLLYFRSDKPITINNDTTFLICKNPKNLPKKSIAKTYISSCFQLLENSCMKVKKNILIELGDSDSKEITMEEMYKIFYEKKNISVRDENNFYICILNPITKEIIFNRLYYLQNQDWMETTPGQQGDSVEWFLQGKLCANDELTNEIGKSFSYTFMKQTCVVKENSLHTLETTGDAPSLVVLDSSEFGPFFLIFLNHYIQINDCNRVFDIFERDGNGTVAEWIVHNNDEKEKNEQDIITLKEKYRRGEYNNLETRYKNELNTAVTNVASYDKASKKIVENMKKYGIKIEDKIRSRDIFNFPHEQEYLFVYAGVRNNFMTNKNNDNTQMINHMPQIPIRRTLEIQTDNDRLHFGLFAVIYGGNNQGASHYFSLIRHYDAYYIHNDQLFSEYDEPEIFFQCDGYPASWIVYVKDLEKIENVGRGYDNTGTPGNLGNSCYLFAIIKVLLLLPGFETKLRNFITNHPSRQNKDEFKWIKLYLQLYDLYFPPM